MGISSGRASGRVRRLLLHGTILPMSSFIALGNSKGFFQTFIAERWLIVCSADIVKMIESQPDLASQIRRVRGGYLKIQGTWMPYEVFGLISTHGLGG
jgi:hypothetical protein